MEKASQMKLLCQLLVRQKFDILQSLESHNDEKHNVGEALTYTGKGPSKIEYDDPNTSELIPSAGGENQTQFSATPFRLQLANSTSVSSTSLAGHE